MTALDTDVLTEILKRNPTYLARTNAIDPTKLAVPVVAAVEILRGRLNSIRQAEAGKKRISLDQALLLFAENLRAIAAYPILPYTAAADALFRQWRAAKIRVGSQDLRIAAICVTYKATLVTRNASDYSQVPGLTLDVWT